MAKRHQYADGTAVMPSYQPFLPRRYILVSIKRRQRIKSGVNANSENISMAWRNGKNGNHQHGVKWRHRKAASIIGIAAAK